MTPNMKRLVRIITRFYNRVDVARELMLDAAELDAGFDAGEFSGPAHWNEFHDECDRLAQRLGFADAFLIDLIATRFKINDPCCTAFRCSGMTPGDLIPR